MKKSQLKVLIKEMVEEMVSSMSDHDILVHPEVERVRRKLFNDIASGNPSDEDDINDLILIAYRLGKSERR